MKESDTPDCIESHPPRSQFWAGLSLFFFCLLSSYGLFCALTSESPSGKASSHLWLSVLAGVLGGGELLAIGVLGIWLMIHAHRSCILVDQSGIRWRESWKNWQFVSWSEITDYYYDNNYQYRRQKSGRVPIVVSARGKFTVSLNPKDVALLCQNIQERATNARVSEWAPFGVRRVDEWPQQFRYWNSAIPLKIAVTTLITLVFFSWITVWLVGVIRWYASVSNLVETERVVCGLALGYLSVLAIPILWIWRYFTAWKRRGEQFTVTPETIRYENTATGELVDVPWSEIGDYFYRIRNGGLKDEGFALVLRGPEEKQITWNRFLLHSEFLLAIVQQYAPRPLAQKEAVNTWRNKSIHEKTGGSDPSTWQGGAVGMGGRVFRNQSVYIASLMGVSTAFCLFLFCSLPVEWNKPVHGEFAFLLKMVLFFNALLLWGWVCFFRTRIETDDMGITHYTPFGKKHLYWYTIQDYRDWQTSASQSSDPSTVIGLNGTRIVFWTTLNGYKELQAEIERLAPPPKTGWHKS